ncbi:hypothetical protein PR202_ga07749 [Eleusine coracana subsp. coracana]|uniref:Short-chain dehydrogenase TIC 32, chloroplastic-like n=1 Tax=Eleusine coracana subsp. coracana TaxID=191504 RepID=A0AAV5C0E0_ELECO|nr:hypothetical protein PR202_ga07749 [Eleusine coracana subsp. coracana]
MAVRNVSSGLAAKEAILSKIPEAKVDVLELDLSSMASVRTFASKFDSLNLPLNILVNNAGVMTRNCSRSCDGLELHFAIHHIGALNDFIAYGQSKLANILHVKELSRILKDEGVNISANAVHPGVIATSLFRNRTIVNAVLNTVGRILCRSVKQGAATTCYVAMHPRVKGISGKYFADCNIANPSSQASDAELAKNLWQFSLRTVS